MFKTNAFSWDPELTSCTGLIRATLAVRQRFEAYLLLFLLSVKGQVEGLNGARM